jgi:hypothetical protein
MYEKALRMKLRFETPQGPLTVEDLWDLPLQTTRANRASLDDVARGLHLQLKSGADISFVDTAKKSDHTAQLKFDIAKHIIDVRLAENAAAATAAANKERKQHLLGILASKENEALLGMSVEELRAAIAAL